MLDDEKCLCGSGRIYGICCKPFSGMKIEDYKRELPYYKLCLKELELELEKKSGRIRKILGKLSPLKEYLILQPQFNGMGINLEKIIEDLKK